MKKYIVSETQFRKLADILMTEEETKVTPPPPAEQGTPETGEETATDTTDDETKDTTDTTDDTTATDTAGGDASSGGGETADDAGSAEQDANSKVTTWSSVVGSKTSRGKANPLGNTVWKQDITRGPANPIGVAPMADRVNRDAANQLTEEMRKYGTFTIDGPYEQTPDGKIVPLANNRTLKSNKEKATIIFRIKNTGQKPLVIAQYKGDSDFQYKGGRNLRFTQEPVQQNQLGTLSFDVQPQENGKPALATFQTTLQIAGQKVEMLPAVGLYIPAMVIFSEHELNNILQIALGVIPIVGPIAMAGIGFYDASLYLKEGDTKTAGLVGFLSILPGIGTIASKIPGVKQLGTKGLVNLALKLSKVDVRGLTNVEKEVAAGIAANEQLVKDGVNQAAKNMVNQNASKVARLTGAAKRTLVRVGRGGLNFGKTLAPYAGAAYGYNKTYDYFERKNQETKNFNIQPIELTTDINAPSRFDTMSIEDLRKFVSGH